MPFSTNMAIASITAAWTQFDANIKYWASTTAAEDLLEAVVYLMAHEPAAMSFAGRSYNRETMIGLRDKMMAHVETSASSRASFTARVRVRGQSRFG
jgi:hypothetical protein